MTKLHYCFRRCNYVSVTNKSVITPEIESRLTRASSHEAIDTLIMLNPGRNNQILVISLMLITQ